MKIALFIAFALGGILLANTERSEPVNSELMAQSWSDFLNGLMSRNVHGRFSGDVTNTIRRLPKLMYKGLKFDHAWMERDFEDQSNEVADYDSPNDDYQDDILCTRAFCKFKK